MNPVRESPCPVSVSCATLAAATEIRRRFGDCCIPRDDARETTVWYSADAPTNAQDTIGRIAHESHQQAESGSGQAALTVFERQRIDFTTTNVFHARSCKAISVEYDIDDWTAYYDPLLNVSEHRRIYARAGSSTGGVDGASMTLREAAPRWHA